jgi:hypothetical protein
LLKWVSNQHPKPFAPITFLIFGGVLFATELLETVAEKAAQKARFFSSLHGHPLYALLFHRGL